MSQQGSHPPQRAPGTDGQSVARGVLIPEWLSNYQPGWLRSDVIAGLTASAVVIPKALAYATIAGLPVQVGLYTALVPMVIYAVLGTSRPLSVSTTTTLAILAGSALGQISPEGDTATLLAASATLALMVGAILIVAGLLRLGFVANFISEPVLVGFKAGIGVVIVLDQLPKLLGTHIDKGSFAHNVLATLQSIGHASLPTVAVSVFTVLLLVGMKHFSPRLPAPLIAVALGILGMSLLNLQQLGVTAVGLVPTGLPSLTLPVWSLSETLWPSALGIALMSFTETIAAGRAFAGNDEPTPQPNRELWATGVANIGGAFLGAMVAGGGTTQTAVNSLAGARSQVAALVTAALALGTCLLLAPFIGMMPNATLAAVVIVYSVGLIEPAEFREILAIRRTEFVWAVVAMIGVMLLGTLQGIVVAIVVSLLALAYQVSDPPVHVLGRKPGTNVFRPQPSGSADDEQFAGMLLLRPEGRVFFANAERIAEKIRPLIDQYRPQVVVLDLRSVFDLEYTALKMLTQAEQRMVEKGVELWLVGMSPSVSAMVVKAPLGHTLGKARIFHNLELAVEHYRLSRP
ncbi:SulP family inorganic anion transporter [Pseudomonas vancouverensis]|uniref:SulP family inorganic anion transporter n=1 Tax=Pseudomonas vancouverensis TaxID=95300 RepID=A0A1H2NSJ5_PSEVA|nr:SulP family inorganic anion transporter [Pseudomonas vancouverensis]KAB0491213.1 SulP family inorganic anion transporter [Pseudomonas vancouverensis]TDB59575.1 SulP family inorganic anion transporter [Pseudomonas vancouverensis]SDV07796.1 high affinity sulphate transporter 1 [Pseudomonas vancouverensis]